MLISWLVVEIQLCRATIDHPNLSTPPKRPVSVLRWNGTANELLELICALWYSGIITNEPGNDISFTGFVRLFEEFFNLKMTKLFDKRSQLAARNRNLTPLLDRIKFAFTENIKKLLSDK